MCILLEPSGTFFDLRLLGCPSVPSHSTISWNLNEHKQPGPINRQNITLRYPSADELDQTVLSCSGRDPVNATCESSSGSQVHSCWWMVPDVDAFCNISGLLRYTMYTFQIRACNNKGCDAKSVNNRTCPDGKCQDVHSIFVLYHANGGFYLLVPSPSIPLDCQIISNSNASFSTLLWKKRRSNSQSVNITLMWINDDLRSDRSFSLYGSSLKPLNDDDSIHCLSQDDIVNCTIRQVTVDHRYRFRIISVNEIGNSTSQSQHCGHLSSNSNEGEQQLAVGEVSYRNIIFLSKTLYIYIYK